MTKFDGVKVFSATMKRDRDILGERVTEWIAGNPHYGIVGIEVTQSSDAEYHCVTITVIWVRRTAASTLLRKAG